MECLNTKQNTFEKVIQSEGKNKSSSRIKKKGGKKGQTPISSVDVALCLQCSLFIDSSTLNHFFFFPYKIQASVVNTKSKNIFNKMTK